MEPEQSISNTEVHCTRLPSDSGLSTSIRVCLQQWRDPRLCAKKQLVAWGFWGSSIAQEHISEWAHGSFDSGCRTHRWLGGQWWWGTILVAYIPTYTLVILLLATHRNCIVFWLHPKSIVFCGTWQCDSAWFFWLHKQPCKRYGSAFKLSVWTWTGLSWTKPWFWFGVQVLPQTWTMVWFGVWKKLSKLNWTELSQH